MSGPTTTLATLDEWIAREALAFPVDAPGACDAAVDGMMTSLGDPVELLGFGEALHGGEEILQLRNRLFQRLVEAHGYRAIAVESSFPRGRVVNEHVAGRGPASYGAIRETGFSHGFGRLEANRGLVAWMRQYNADAAHQVKVRFYGFDIPIEMVGTDSPRVVLRFVLDYLTSLDGENGAERRERIESLLGADADWENAAASMDPSAGVGLSAAAATLRIETEELISELQVRRPELVDRGGRDRYLEALQYAAAARQLLNYHAALARESANRISELLGIRDALMADILTAIVARERGRGKVLAFAHNSHLGRSRIAWRYGPHPNRWWPAGAHLKELFGARYASIGSGVGTSEANGIGQPEPGTLEALLTSTPGQAVLLPMQSGAGLPAPGVAGLATRTGSTRNPSYTPFSPQSFTDFDWLAVLPSTTDQRGGPPRQRWVAKTTPEA